MEEETTQTPGKGKGRMFAETLGLLLTAAVAFVLGWFAQVLRANSLASRQQAEAAAAQAAAVQARPVTVETARATLRTMNPPHTAMGHVEPIESTDLRAQIDGTILEVAFKEGSTVQAGDLLYRIDPRVYEARVAQAKAALAKAKAASENADRYYSRISKVNKGSVSEAEVDQAYATMLESKAAIAQCEADLTNAEINLGYTSITAPISGRIGKSLLKKGDYVAPSMGSLARIVQTNPMRVVFSVPDKDFLRGARLMDTEGHVATIRAQLQLADGTIYDHDGTLDFTSNEMDSSTASLPVRYSFPNPDQLLLSNAYVSVLLSETEPKQTLAVPASAVLANATGDYVYTINDEGRAVRRIVSLGAHQSGFVEVLSGLQEGEEVVSDGVVNVSDNSLLKVVNPAVAQ